MLAVSRSTYISLDSQLELLLLALQSVSPLLAPLLDSQLELTLLASPLGSQLELTLLASSLDSQLGSLLLASPLDSLLDILSLVERSTVIENLNMRGCPIISTDEAKRANDNNENIILNSRPCREWRCNHAEVHP